jgi:hypothetical protein
MEVEDFTKQQIFDTMCKLVDNQKKEAAAILEEHRQTTKAVIHEHTRTTVETLNEIHADLGEIQLPLDHGYSKVSTAPATSSPPITPCNIEIVPSGHSDDKFCRGKATETQVPYVPPPARGAHFG